MDTHPADYYHNRRDDHDNIDRDCIAKTCEVLLEAVLWYDRHGLRRPLPAGNQFPASTTESDAAAVQGAV